MDPDLVEFWKSCPEDPFDALFEHAPVMMHSIDADRILTKVSQHWARHLGYDRAEMIGRRYTDFLTPASRRHAEELILPEFLRTGVKHNVPYEFVRRDGSVAPVLLSACSVLDDQGRFLRSLTVIFDNTEAARAYEALAEKAAQLAEANAAKSDFMATMSHEIRTPLNAMMGFAQLLQKSGLDDIQLGQVAAILTAGHGLMTLLTDLLDVTRFEDRAPRVDTRVVDLDQMVATVAELWLPFVRQKGLRLSVSRDTGLPKEVLTDPLRLQQVLNNFLSNAVKVTEAGRIDLRVEEIARRGPFSELCFSVTDSGPGLPEGGAAALFQPFTRAGGPEGGQAQGWGLGLSICRRIAEAMDARIEAQSLPEGGSRFSFTLDLARHEPAPGRPPAPLPAAPPVRSLRILLAEDNHVNAALIQRLLDDLGHRTTRVETGFDALRRFRDEPFDLVLMDIMMPGLGGIEAAQAIRDAETETSPRMAATPIVAHTALLSQEARRRYREAGIDGVLAKPLDHGRLIEMLGRVAGSQAAARP